MAGIELIVDLSKVKSGNANLMPHLGSSANSLANAAKRFAPDGTAKIRVTLTAIRIKDYEFRIDYLNGNGIEIAPPSFAGKASGETYFQIRPNL